MIEQSKSCMMKSLLMMYDFVPEAEQQHYCVDNLFALFFLLSVFCFLFFCFLLFALLPSFFVFYPLCYFWDFALFICTKVCSTIQKNQAKR